MQHKQYVNLLQLYYKKGNNVKQYLHYFLNCFAAKLLFGQSVLLFIPSFFCGVSAFSDILEIRLQKCSTLWYNNSQRRKPRKIIKNRIKIN